MGIIESTLKVESLKYIIKPEPDSRLPHLTVECAKFADEKIGFVVTNVDIAKNSSVTNYVVNTSYSPLENTLVYVCTDESVFTFSRDRVSERVFCIMNSSKGLATLVRQCNNLYEPIGNDELDKIGALYRPLS